MQYLPSHLPSFLLRIWSPRLPIFSPVQIICTCCRIYTLTTYLTILNHTNCKNFIWNNENKSHCKEKSSRIKHLMALQSLMNPQKYRIIWVIYGQIAQSEHSVLRKIAPICCIGFYAFFFYLWSVVWSGNIIVCFILCPFIRLIITGFDTSLYNKEVTTKNAIEMISQWHSEFIYDAAWTSFCLYNPLAVFSLWGCFPFHSSGM